MIFYFAYGSNLHPVRLAERVSSAVCVSSCTLPGHRLDFHKRGRDNSGKCSLVYTGRGPDRVHGAIYRIASCQKARLDEFEDRDAGYRDAMVRLNLGGSPVDCCTYYAGESLIDEEARPFHWYKSLVILGALFHRFPTPYITAALDVESVPDADAMRKRENLALISRLTAYSRR